MGTRIFYTTDVHGSERCFRKFLNAGKAYKVSVLIIGGDITGKMIIPIVKNGDKYETKFLGKKFELKTDEELRSVQQKIRDSGYYYLITTEEEREKLNADSAYLDATFSQVMNDSMKEWVKLAEERMKGSGIRCVINPGNDDSLDVDPILEGSDYVEFPEGKVIKIDDRHEMISTGYTNITPWPDLPRDISDEKLGEKIEQMASKVENMENAIFNFHCPPYNSGIDNAPKLDETLKPVTIGGQLLEVPVGSQAVRAAMEKYQPLLGMHGHIHESKGAVNIGRTLCLNPGSEYPEGILRGVIVELEDKKIKNYIFTSG